jgi:hypothetical protein
MKTESINIPDDLQAIIRRVVERYSPYVRPHAVRRAALRAGLRMLDAEPGLLASLITEEDVHRAERRAKP